MPHRRRNVSSRLFLAIGQRQETRTGERQKLAHREAQVMTPELRSGDSSVGALDTEARDDLAVCDGDDGSPQCYRDPRMILMWRWKARNN